MEITGPAVSGVERALGDVTRLRETRRERKRWSHFRDKDDYKLQFAVDRLHCGMELEIRGATGIGSDPMKNRQNRGQPIALKTAAFANIIIITDGCE